MVQIVNRPPSFSERLGTGIGQTLSSNIQQLAQNRIEKMKMRELGQAYEKAYGLPPEIAKFSPQIQHEIVKQRLKEPGRLSQEQFLQEQGLPSGLTKFETPIQSALIKRLLPQSEQASLEDILTNINQGPLLPQENEQISALLQKKMGIAIPESSNIELEPSTIPELKESIEKEHIQVAQPKTISEQKKQINEFANAQPLGYELAPMAKANRELEGLRKALTNPHLKPSQKSALRKHIESKEDKYEKQQDKINKETETFYSKINDDSSTSTEANQRLDKMLSLINSGNLVGPTLGAFLETAENLVPALGVGINLFGLTSTETQEFRKLQADFLRDVKKVFGARVTNDEVKRYLNRIPSITQSDEGKKAVIEDLKLFNQAAIAKKEAMDEIIAENGGYRPHNLDKLVEERTKKELDIIAQEFKKPIEVSLPELQQEYEQRKSIPGQLLGGIASALRI